MTDQQKQDVTWLDVVERVATRMIPDTGFLIMAGMFAMAWKVLTMIDANPALLKESDFMMIVTLIFGGSGIGAVIAWRFGGTKTGGDVMKAQSAAVIANNPAPTNPAEPTK